jgi:hypothetical protein
MAYNLFITTTLLIFTTASLAKFSTKKIELKVGESTSLTIKEHYNLKLSRKGIVDMSYRQKDSWKITGLKPGFVLLKTINYEDTPTSQIHIWVKDSSKKKTTFFPQWMCSQKNIICKHNHQTLEGQSHNPHFFYKAKSWCQAKNNCYFKTKLNALGQTAAKKSLRKHFLHEKITVFANGDTSVIINCNSKDNVKTKTTKELKKTINHKQYFVKCLHETTKEQYKISAKIFVTEKSHNKQVGLDSNLNTNLSSNTGISADASLTLKSLLNTNTTQIIGEPFIISKSGQQNLIKTGSEFPTKTSSSKNLSLHPHVIWKEYGLSLQTTVFPLLHKKVEFHYEFQLKTPGLAQKISSLKTNKIKGNIEIPLSSPIILGGVLYNIKKTSNSTFAFIKKIPILSPLLKLKNFKKTYVYMYLSIRVDVI